MNGHLHKYKKLSEDKLLKAYLEEGDKLAYSELYSRYLAKTSAALNVFLSKSNIDYKQYVFDEVIQETLKKLLESESFKEGKIKNYDAYLFITVKHTFIAHCKKAKKRITNETEYQRTYVHHITDGGGQEEIEEKRKKVDEAIQKLKSKKQKEAIILRMSGLSYRMIAREMGTEEGRIRNYISRARKAIRKILGL